MKKPKNPTTKMYSLHFGVNYVDTDHYGNSLSDLPCCARDASYMMSLMQKLGFDDSKIFTNEKATTKNFGTKVRSAARKLKKDDLLVITYSGHGGRIIDINKDEKPGTDDSTWCFYDRQLIDDELRHFWGKFRKGVNILVVLDACHSGTAFKALVPGNRGKSFAALEDNLDVFRPMVKTMGADKSFQVFKNNGKIYKPISKQPIFPLSKIKASVQLMAACQDEEQALAGSVVSVFTDLILRNISNTKKIKTYKQLFDKVKRDSQKSIHVSPNWISLGPKTKYFLQQRPFIKKGKRYPKDFKNIHEGLIFGEEFSESKGVQLDGLIVETSTESQRKVMLASNEQPLSKTAKNKSTKGKKVDGGTEQFFVDAPKRKGISNPWDQAYAYYESSGIKSKGFFVEPAFYETKPAAKTSNLETLDEYLDKWPNPRGHENEFTWHLSEDFSQLAKARDEVIQKIKKADQKIRIAHVDSGYSPKHPMTPAKIKFGKSFVKDESTNKGIEVVNKGKIAEIEYHGTGTIALLAGGELKANQTFTGFSGNFGAIPFAEIVPIRISDTVALVGILRNTKQFTQAVEYAITHGCEVITMSMGGQPHRSWAKAINRAYENGITIVTAAGNSFNSGVMRVLPKKLIYPARFERVIAATGIAFNKEPYNFEANSHYPSKMAGGNNMQGNHGPQSAMRTAIAAYTPNMPWAEMDGNKPIFRRSGGGTSAATPQVAAAAALWIVKHRKALKRKKYAGTWKQVEAVKHALFSTADKSYPLWSKYYGNGSLKAWDALQIPPVSDSKLKQAEKARVTPFAFLEFIQLMIFRKGKTKQSRDSNLEEMISLEMLQILHQDPALHHLVEELDFFEKKKLKEEQFNFIFNKVKNSPFASNFLKRLNNGKNT